MALAISLVFDPATSARVDALWHTLADARASRDMLELGYPPHVTLIVADDDSMEPQMRGALAKAAGAAPLTIKLGPVCRFEGTDITWLAADGGIELRRLHRVVAEAMPLESIRPYYRPDQWVPHMTLQTAGDAGAGQALLAGMWPDEWSGRALRLELARFVPVVVLDGMALS